MMTSSISSTAHSCVCRPRLRLSAPPNTSTYVRRVRPCSMAIRAKGDDGSSTDIVKSAAKVAAGFVDTAAGWVPDSVPRSAAKVGVAVVGALIVFSIVQKVLSTLFTVLLLGGGLYLWYRSSSSSDDDSGSGKGKRRDDDDVFKMDGEDDALSEARRIMKKYK